MPHILPQMAKEETTLDLDGHEVRFTSPSKVTRPEPDDAG
jgi:hypothetical protein